eukprot:564465-Rhodomonas_salina.1
MQGLGDLVHSAILLAVHVVSLSSGVNLLVPEARAVGVVRARATAEGIVGPCRRGCADWASGAVPVSRPVLVFGS